MVFGDFGVLVFGDFGVLGDFGDFEDFGVFGDFGDFELFPDFGVFGDFGDFDDFPDLGLLGDFGLLLLANRCRITSGSEMTREFSAKIYRGLLKIIIKSTSLDFSSRELASKKCKPKKQFHIFANSTSNARI